MYNENQTIVTEFLLLGFQDLHHFKFPLFFLFLVICLIVLVINPLIIVLVSTSNQLKTPMYLFLSHLSLTDILVTGSIVPNMLHIILKEGATISFSGCIIQLFIFGASEMVECFLLTSMSYDRYLAICKPLHYSTIMNNQLQFHLLFISWFVGVTLTTGLVFQIYMFEFCSSNIIDHLYCDFTPVLDLSCSNTYILKLEDFIAAASITITSFTFIIVTYGSIFVTIIRSPSTTGRQKAFSTCSSHLLVVSAFYGTLITIYGVPSWAQSLNLNKSLSLLNTLLTPLFNPVIYSLRSKEIKGALKKLMIINALGAYPKHCQAMSWES